MTLDKLLKLPEHHQFISSSAEKSVGTDPLQGGCGDQSYGRYLAPFLAQGWGVGAFSAETLGGKELKWRCLRYTE